MPYSSHTCQKKKGMMDIRPYMDKNIIQQALQFLRNKLPTSTYTDMPQGRLQTQPQSQPLPTQPQLDQASLQHAMQMNQRQAQTPANWPGYQEAFAKQQMPQDNIDIKKLLAIVMQLIGKTKPQ